MKYKKKLEDMSFNELIKESKKNQKRLIIALKIWIAVIGIWLIFQIIRLLHMCKVL